MADRYPLIYNPSANQIQELQSGDSLDVGNSAVKGATGYATTTGTSSQFLKADGSLDGTTYLTSSGTAQLAQGLTGTPTIAISDITGVNATFSGNLTVNGTTTTIDTAVTEVDSLEVAANNNNVAVAITQSGAGKAMTVEGGDVGIGTDNPVGRLHLAKNSATGPSFYITNDSTGHTNADGLQIGFDGSNNAQIRNRENTQLKLYTNNAERLTISNNGVLTVGSGANTATQRAGLLGGYTVFENSAGTGNPSITFNNDIDTGLLNPSANTLVFNTGGSERLRISDNGSIGIGTAAPQAPFGGRALHLGNISDTRSVLTLQSSTTGRNSIYFSDGITGGDTYRGYIDYIHSDNAMTFGVETSEKLRITSAGNVGINSTAPSGKLDVGGNVFPAADNVHDLGSASKRWANVYTGDLNLSNEGSANDVDGTWGQYTIQEGEDDLFLINRRTGKKYKFNLTEVN